MKTILFTTVILAALACSTIGFSKEAKGNETEMKSNPESLTTVSGKKSLIVYFSMPETTDPNKMTTDEDNSVVVIDGKVLGNTQYMAYVIQKTTGADIFRIEPVTPYPTNHATLVDRAEDEKDANARPATAKQIENFAQYDTVFIGYPIWWSDMPMILYTFFEGYDFAGKTIVPFSTLGGSRFARTPKTIQQLEPEAKILDGLTISRDRIQNAEQRIVNWVNRLDL
ncbi:flavodoxin [Syntrophotalea acetylenica]|uniref:Flavodoxin n=1 Tax=Syntrophotalea acetylenica TaxID=29542 RepID=A0A1L3GDE3_SYNAC|nr:flavodoxin [Syntrophotalea acetylenica]APG23971.1 flavodoxin [Syntrophotalea acetylenica]APG44553.1 flavodoxin [Syntrophotalea acetylenica]